MMPASTPFNERLTAMLEHDPLRLAILELVRQLALPQCYVSAGFVRNMVWDELHSYTTHTPLNDIDVIYFDPDEPEARAGEYETYLGSRLPGVTWQVKNQAHMHLHNGHVPYTDTLHAMSFWPEKETAVAVRKLNDGSFDWQSVFGFDSLFALQVTANPAREFALFEERVANKQWQVTWPRLTLVRHVAD